MVSTLIYVLLILVVLALVWQARHWALSQLVTPQSRADWRTWREDVRQQQDPQAGTVARRVPKSTEPPGLVLLRDYFSTCVVAAVVFASVLYAIFAWLLLGAMSTRGNEQ